MAKRKPKFWKDEEILQAIDLLPRVVEESGGHSISNKSETLRRFAKSSGRTYQSVNNKFRKLAEDDPTYSINQYGPRGKSSGSAQTVLIEETPPLAADRTTARVVNIPLKKLYGLLDYETFMSLIDG